MKRILFGLSLLAVLLMAGTAFANTANYWQPWKVVVGAAETYVWQPFNARNESMIEQTGAFSTAFVTQLNDQSFSWIDQGTDFGSDLASVYQNSPCCYLSYTAFQFTAPYVKSLNFPMFTEDYYQNTSLIYQNDGHYGYSAHAAYVYQWGDGNWSSIWQTGTNDTAGVTQSGSFNASFIRQDGYGVNVASVTQIGDLNYNDILQDGGINNAQVYQGGFGNFSLVSQTDGFCSLGGYNNAVVNQIGYMNDSVIIQAGGGVHSAYVTQANNCFTASLPTCAGAGCR
ncbi:hypothetical protein AAU61_05095 [Desulfocarbo indianensis]|nr:hypothetical protein AAU61_05095 [Desulfocarbo indianensis]